MNLSLRLCLYFVSAVIACFAALGISAEWVAMRLVPFQKLLTKKIKEADQ